MKKIMILFILAASLFVNSSVSRADVIWEPDKDVFYASHKSECVYLQREYIANGPEGELIIYESPLSDREIERVENGTRLWVNWVFEDDKGRAWGDYSELGHGWFPLAYTDLVYDYISFEEEHIDELQDQSGQIDAVDAEYISLWKYPGSPELEALYVSPDYMPEYSKVYEDEEGRTWAYCTYYQGWRNFWMCLDDVTADYKAVYGEKPDESAVMLDTEEREDFEEQIVPEVPSNDKWIIGLGIAGVIVVTAAILAVMKKRNVK